MIVNFTYFIYSMRITVTSARSSMTLVSNHTTHLSKGFKIQFLGFLISNEYFLKNNHKSSFMIEHPTRFLSSANPVRSSNVLCVQRRSDTTLPSTGEKPHKNEHTRLPRQTMWFIFINISAKLVR